MRLIIWLLAFVVLGGAIPTYGLAADSELCRRDLAASSGLKAFGFELGKSLSSAGIRHSELSDKQARPFDGTLVRVAEVNDPGQTDLTGTPLETVECQGTDTLVGIQGGKTYRIDVMLGEWSKIEEKRLRKAGVEFVEIDGTSKELRSSGIKTSVPVALDIYDSIVLSGACRKLDVGQSCKLSRWEVYAVRSPRGGSR